MNSHTPHTTPAAPVAVIGIGCRFPGAASPAEFWRLLRGGEQPAGEVPDERWQPYRDLGPEYEAALRRAIRGGSFLTGIEGFDADFFGVPPREAEAMDPQQRLLLEVSWEALEHAGLPPLNLAGTDTGVFIGVSTTDYGNRLLEDLPGLDAWTSIGAATCALANRVSYALDLRGPSMAVDTACSASLVAVHLACQSLQTGESSVALAGGANLIVSPGQTISLDAAGTLAPDGRSKSFDAAADGYGRGEGCGVLVLKRLADAERDGDPVLGVIVGSAVNQDGRTDGIMAPCGSAQEHVVWRAADRAGLTPGDVDYVEAHGTGTQVGDRIEATALAATYGAGRPPQRPCLIGSVKANIGHLEGAAGVAGLVKAVLALHHGLIPPTPRHRGASPDIDWANSGLRLTTEPVPWSRQRRARRAAVSSFGYGGTIAHVIVQEAPARETEPSSAASAPAPARLVPVSARSAAALRERAEAIAQRLTDAPSPLPDVAHTLAHRRSHLEHRAVVSATDTAELVAGLRALSAEEPHPGLVAAAEVTTGDTDAVWVFSGHGSQWAGMGGELLRTEPAFRAAIDGIAPVFAEEAGLPLHHALREGELGSVDRVQMLIFAVQYGLAELWRAYGARPAAVVGHSVGEIAAAVTAGILTPEDGARLSCRRSRLIRQAAGAGAMAMVSLPFDTVWERLAGRTDLAAAIFASPESTVVAGDSAAVEAVLEQWPAEGIGVRRVASEVAFHSPHMDPLTGELAAAAADLSPRSPEIPMYSTVLPDPRTAPAGDGRYWAANLREPVRLCPAIQAAAADGHRRFLEISPHPVVTHSIREVLDSADVDSYFAGLTLRRDRPQADEFRAAVAAAHCHGVRVDWRKLQPDGALIDLPGYPWQHHRYWRDPSGAAAAGTGGHDIAGHTLLGAATTAAGTPVRLWHTTLTDDSRPYPGSHQVLGAEIIPAAVLALTFLNAVRDGDGMAIHDLSMTVPLRTAGRQHIQVVADGDVLRLAARPADAGESDWLVHATARSGSGAPPHSRTDAVAGQVRNADPGQVRQHLGQVGVPATAFDWQVERLLVGDGVVRARVGLSRSTGAATWAAVLDASTSVALLALPGPPRLRMIDHADRLTVTGAPPDPVLIEVAATGEHTVDVRVSAPGGEPVAHLDGLRYPIVPQLAESEPGAAEQPGPALTGGDPERMREQLASDITTVIATEMRLAPAALDAHRPLVEQGLDSVMTVVVRRRLERRYGQMLPAALFWEKPTISGIADHLATALSGLGSPAGQPIEA